MERFAVQVGDSMFDGGSGLLRGSSVFSIAPPSAEAFAGNAIRLSYVVGSNSLSYYPSSLYDVFLDISAELEALDPNSLHELAISGYPLASVEVRNSQVEFRRLHQDGTFGLCDLQNVESALVEARAYVAKKLLA